jgi:ribosomal protein S27AE
MEKMDIPVWGSVTECNEAEHEIEVIENKKENCHEWICTKCGYIEWFTPICNHMYKKNLRENRWQCSKCHKMR